MNRLVFTVFKTIMVAMIAVFAFDMGSYLYRTMSLNQRMNNIMTGMQRVVSDNNGLTSEQYTVYNDMFNELAENYNGPNHEHQFINGFWINYNTQALNTETMTSIAPTTGRKTIMNNSSAVSNQQRNYGDLVIVQVGVQIVQPTWDFIGSERGSQNFQNDRTSGTIQPSTHNLWYTYYVPCLKYQYTN